MIRYLILGLFVCLAWNTVQAQTQRGTHLLGGQASVSNLFKSGEDTNNYFEFSVVPDYGYFFWNNIALGTFFDLTYANRGGEISRLEFSIKPFARYYFPSERKWRFFLNGSIGGGLDRIKVDEDNLQSEVENPFTRGRFDFDLGPGVNYFFTRSVALEGYFFYDGYRREGEDFRSTLGIRFGIQAFLFKSE